MLHLQRNLDTHKNQLVCHQIQNKKLKWNIYALAAMSPILLHQNCNGFKATVAKKRDIENVTKDYEAPAYLLNCCIPLRSIIPQSAIPIINGVSNELCYRSILFGVRYIF